MSKLRPTLGTNSTKPCMTNGTAYLMMLNAIQTREGLIDGALEKHGEFCTIGAYFHINDETSLPSAVIDEVAAMNDSMPMKSPRQRKAAMAKWLRWKLTSIGMPGFAPLKRKPASRPQQERG